MYSMDNAPPARPRSTTFWFSFWAQIALHTKSQRAACTDKQSHGGTAEGGVKKPASSEVA
jgi:hypothetical protein